MGLYPRKNTVVLNLRSIPKRLTHLDVHLLIQNCIGVTVDQVVAIHYDMLKNVVFLKLAREDLAEKIADKFVNGIKFLDAATSKEYIVPITREMGLTSVRVHQIPIDVPNSLIVSALSLYGTVVGNVVNETFGQHMPYASVYSGVRSVRMTIKKPIPSFVEIDGEKTLVTYTGQIKTCMRCGSSDHFKAECTVVKQPNMPAANRLRTMAEIVSGRFADSVPLTLEKLGSSNEVENVTMAEVHEVPETQEPPCDEPEPVSDDESDSEIIDETPSYEDARPPSDFVYTKTLPRDNEHDESDFTNVTPRRSRRNNSRKKNAPYSRSPSRSKIPKNDPT